MEEKSFSNNGNGPVLSNKFRTSSERTDDGEEYHCAGEGHIGFAPRNVNRMRNVANTPLLASSSEQPRPPNRTTNKLASSNITCSSNSTGKSKEYVDESKSILLNDDTNAKQDSTATPSTTALLGRIPQHSSLSDNTSSCNVVLTSPPLPPILQQFMDDGIADNRGGENSGSMVEIVSGVGLMNLGKSTSGMSVSSTAIAGAATSVNNSRPSVDACGRHYVHHSGGARTKTTGDNNNSSCSGVHEKHSVSFDPNPIIHQTACSTLREGKLAVKMHILCIYSLYNSWVEQ